MPDNARRDANIERLFSKLDDIKETVHTTRSEVQVMNVKVDDFSFRLKKLESQHEKHIEREEKLELLTAKLESMLNQYEGVKNELTSKVDALEKDVTTIKNNWGWLIALISTLGGIAGFITNAVVSFILSIMTKQL